MGAVVAATGLVAAGVVVVAAGLAGVGVGASSEREDLHDASAAAFGGGRQINGGGSRCSANVSRSLHCCALPSAANAARCQHFAATALRTEIAQPLTAARAIAAHCRTHAAEASRMQAKATRASRPKAAARRAMLASGRRRRDARCLGGCGNDVKGLQACIK